MTPQWLLDEELTDTMSRARKQAHTVQLRTALATVDRTSDQWQRLRASCSPHSGLPAWDVDRHVDLVFLTVNDNGSGRASVERKRATGAEEV